MHVPTCSTNQTNDNLTKSTVPLSKSDEFTNQITALRNKINSLTASDLALANQETDKVKNRYKVTDSNIEPVVRRSLSKKRDQNLRRSLEFNNSSTEDDSSLPPPLPSTQPPNSILEPDEESSGIPILNFKKSVHFLPQNAISTNESELAFEPIHTTRSTENLSINIVKPIPRYADTILSKSTQDLRTAKDPEFRIRPVITSKSSDDLIFPDIDGLRRSLRRSKRWKLRKSHESIMSFCEDDIYANIQIGDADVRKPAEPLLNGVPKKPHPLPRSNSIDLEANKKTIVYVFDEAKEQFVLQHSDEKSKLPDRSANQLADEDKAQKPSVAGARLKFPSFFGLGQKKEQDISTVQNRLFRIKSLEDLDTPTENKNHKRRASNSGLLSKFKSTSKENLLSNGVNTAPSSSIFYVTINDVDDADKTNKTCKLKWSFHVHPCFQCYTNTWLIWFCIVFKAIHQLKFKKKKNVLFNVCVRVLYCFINFAASHQTVNLIYFYLSIVS